MITTITNALNTVGRGITTAVRASADFCVFAYNDPAAAASAVVGNSPEEIKARKELGILDPVTEEERELGIPAEKKEPPAHRRGYYHS